MIEGLSEQGKRIAAIRERVENATPGPWRSHDTDEGAWLVSMPSGHGQTVSRLYFGDMEDNEGKDLQNADFIAAAREDVPWLLERIAELREAVASNLDPNCDPSGDTEDEIGRQCKHRISTDYCERKCDDRSKYRALEAVS